MLKKILYIIIWAGCITLLSFAYEDYLYSQFEVNFIQGSVDDKGVNKITRNIYGNFTEEHEYWIQLGGEKISVTKSVYENTKEQRNIRIMSTQHGLVVVD